MASNSPIQHKSNPIRIALADDSETLRRVLTFVLSADPELQICLTARHGQEAVTQFRAARPDVVLLDVEMPVMDGIEAAAAIRNLDARIPIIMFSTLTSNGAEATLDALTSGATDYVTKPSACGHMTQAFEYLRSELIPKIKRWGQWFQRTRDRQTGRDGFASTGPAAGAVPLSTGRRNGAVDVVAIGVSTGGPNALAELLKEVPGTFPVPILITQHMPVLFTKLLADRLGQICRLTVREGVSGALVEPGQVWIAPGDQHMIAQRVGASVRLQLHQGPMENSCRPSVDVMFRSVAESYRAKSLAVILTGMGQDGLLGCQQIRERGGRILAQDEASSVVWGMPRAVVRAGLADRVLPLSEIAQEMIRITRNVSQATTTQTAADSERVV